MVYQVPRPVNLPEKVTVIETISTATVKRDPSLIFLSFSTFILLTHKLPDQDIHMVDARNKRGEELKSRNPEVDNIDLIFRRHEPR